MVQARPAEKVLAAFAEQFRMDLQELTAATGLDAIEVSAAVRELSRRGLLMRQHIYSRKGEAYVPLNLGLDENHLPALFGLDEREARSRLLMVKRMKERLISEYHPMLDLVIADYERGLRNVEGIRYGTDDDPYRIRLGVNHG